MNKNTIYGVVAAAVIIIAVAAVAGYYLLMNPGGETPPTPVTVETATSLKYDATVTSQGSDIPYQFAGTDLNTTSLKLRIDVLGGESGNYSYILNAEDQTAWSAVNGEWTDVSSDFTNQWTSWGTLWTNYMDALKSWSGTGDYTFTDTNGDSVHISNISLNPTLAASLFQHS
jgi:hypothetical protein